MVEEGKFCTGCGRALEPGMQFCPQCGKVVYGSDAEAEYRKQASELEAFVKESRMNWVLFALAVYAIPATVAGLVALLDAGSTANLIWSNADFQNWVAQHDYDVTLDTVKGYVTAAAALGFLSGLCALASMLCVIKRRMWKVAVAACLLASLFCSWSIIGFFAGLMMTWMVFSLKEMFSDRA
jgi:predicted RNA-binding Zn-ribbon protein involved in translation (DUF1610 family)